MPPSGLPAGAQGGTSACHTGAALSFVSCIRLFGRTVHTPTTMWAPADSGLCQIVRLIHATASIYTTLEGVARRATSVGRAGEAAAPHPGNRRDRPTSHVRGDEHRTYLASPLGRGTRRCSRNIGYRAWLGCSQQAGTLFWGAAAAPSEGLTRAPCPRPGRSPRDGLPLVGRTPGISCEAVPAYERDGAGMRRHVHPGNLSWFRRSLFSYGLMNRARSSAGIARGCFAATCS